jgi:HlyD family secretion protein
MARDKTRFLWVPIAAIAVAALIYMLRPAAVTVDVATIARGDLVVAIEEEGRTRVHDRYVISAPVAGVLERVRVRAGDQVKRGDVIAALRPAPAPPLDTRTEAQSRARLAASEDAVARAQATHDAALVELTQAKTDGQRAVKLAADGAMSVAQAEVFITKLRTAEQNAAVAAAAVGVAEHNRDEARAALLTPRVDSHSTPMALRAPVSAAILRVVEEHERVVAAGTPVIELGDPRAIEIVVDLLSTDAVRVRPGARVLLENWGGGQTLQGLVRRVEPSTFTKISALGVEEQRANVIIDFDCPHDQLVGDGYAIDVRIIVDHRQDVLVLPLGALVRAADGWAVYVVDSGGRARRRPVVTGARAAFEVEVLEGLTAGEQVVLYPGERVAEGTRVIAAAR